MKCTNHDSEQASYFLFYNDICFPSCFDIFVLSNRETEERANQMGVFSYEDDEYVQRPFSLQLQNSSAVTFLKHKFLVNDYLQYAPPYQVPDGRIQQENGVWHLVAIWFTMRITVIHFMSVGISKLSTTMDKGLGRTYECRGFSYNIWHTYKHQVEMVAYQFMLSSISISWSCEANMPNFFK